MNVLPVITRELRAQARQPFTYLLRLYGVAALLVAACFVVFQPGFTAGSGPELFLRLHRASLAAIWLLIPLGAADCLSRERREGTLGLLFLTPLSPYDIVVAKGVAHGCRASMLWVASLPVQVLPYLLGGIGWQVMVVSGVVNFCSILLVVAVSVLASALCRDPQRALGLTAAIGTLLVAAVAFFASLVSKLVFVPSLWLFGQPCTFEYRWLEWWEDWWATVRSPADCVMWFIELAQGGVWTWFGGRMQPLQYYGESLLTLGIGAALVLVLALHLMMLAARIISGYWRESVTSPRVEQLERAVSRPVLGGRLVRGWLRRRLERNPIGWLEQRSWSGRMVVWTWLGVLVAFYSFVLTAGLGRFMYAFGDLQLTLAGLLLLSITAAAAGSFRRERETGMLELLLVTPLSERQIITGRLRGIWRQFLPSVGLLVFIWVFAAGFLEGANPWNALWVCSSFVTLPIIGLRNSLSFSSYIGAFIATVTLGLIVPVLAENLALLWQGAGTPNGLRSAANWQAVQRFWEVFGIAIQAIIAVALLLSLHGNLVQRRFARERKLT